MELTYSELCSKFAKDEAILDIQIYSDGETGWFLELVDEAGNSTCWENSFTTDKEAYEEAMNAIEEEGIKTFVGVPT